MFRHSLLVTVWTFVHSRKFATHSPHPSHLNFENCLRHTGHTGVPFRNIVSLGPCQPQKHCSIFILPHLTHHTCRRKYVFLFVVTSSHQRLCNPNERISDSCSCDSQSFVMIHHLVTSLLSLSFYPLFIHLF